VNKKTLMILAAASMVYATLAMPGYADSTAAPTTCKDGTTSTVTGRGACSKHGGVQKGAAAGTAAPAAATAKCKDGSYSTAKNHKGACSKHGGVSDWLQK
jgi:hypothetical protein